ncbi:hypothetical protein Y032_1133g3665 [Ancylostoma ceylanicum]|nr:hypothetical protein Y032_1133g3665 [Ancylostoma ceylanicum]
MPDFRKVSFSDDDTVVDISSFRRGGRVQSRFGSGTPDSCEGDGDGIGRESLPKLRVKMVSIQELEHFRPSMIMYFSSCSRSP